MHASSNLVALFKGSDDDRRKAYKKLQNDFDESFEDGVRLVIEETYEVVWLEDIATVFVRIAKQIPELDFVVSGYVDCSENSGEFMDFGIIYQNGRLEIYSSDWEGYDDVDFDDDGDADDCYGRYDRFLELAEMDVEDTESSFQEMCQMIKEKDWFAIAID